MAVDERKLLDRYRAIDTSRHKVQVRRGDEIRQECCTAVAGAITISERTYSILSKRSINPEPAVSDAGRRQRRCEADSADDG